MDKSKRKSLIKSYLTNSINIREFSSEIDMDLQAMSDPILGAIRSDLSDKNDALFIKSEILAFDQKQEEGVDSLASDYIENEKRRLTLQACGYTSLLADPEIRMIMEKWKTTNEIALFETSAEEYKNTSFTHLLKFLEDHPEYDSEIKEILAEIESENSLSDELQEFSDTVNNKEEEQKSQDAKREEFKTFMDETLQAFDTLLQLDDIDEETIENIRVSASQTYKIYRDKYLKLIAELSKDPKVFENKLYPTLEIKTELVPDLQGKFEQIENIIKQLEEKYGNFTQDIDGKEDQEEIWKNRLQAKDIEVDQIPDGVNQKQDVAQLIQALDRDIQRNNQQDHTNTISGQR